MNTGKDFEATRFDNIDEKTQFLNEPPVIKGDSEEKPMAVNDKKTEKKRAGATLKNVGSGAATGLVVGALAPFMMGMAKNPAPEDEVEVVNEEDTTSEAQPEWVDQHVPVAHNVNDSMSFSQAFATARNEVGPGGCFEWRGQVYGTFTADEWNHMSAEERAEWNQHFNWNEFESSSTSSTTYHSSTSNTSSGHSEPATSQTSTPQTGRTSHEDDDDDDIEVVSSRPGTAQNVSQPNPQPSHPENNPGNNEEGVQVLGIVHDDDLDANVGYLSIDGHDAVVIDVNNDMVFDVLLVDENDNGTIEDNEQYNIQDMNLTVNSLGGFSDGTGGMLADNDQDYSEDPAGMC